MPMWLTHKGRGTHICVSKLTIIGSDNGLSPGRRRAIIWTNAGILLIRIEGTTFSEILSESHPFSFKKMHFKMSCVKLWSFCLGLNILTHWMFTLFVVYFQLWIWVPSRLTWSISAVRCQTHRERVKYLHPPYTAEWNYLSLPIVTSDTTRFSIQCIRDVCFTDTCVIVRLRRC